MLRFLIFAVLTLTVLATDVPDLKRCAEGPKFWCANLKNAKACQATNHCIQAVWIVQAYPKDSDVTCKVCEGLVVEARKYIARGETEKSIENLIVSECKKVPYAAVSEECTSLAQNYLPEIMQLLAAETDPLTVCTAMRLCNNRRIDEVTRNAPATTVSPLVDAGLSDTSEITFNECDVCQLQMGDIARQFKWAADETVMDRMFMVCGELGTFSTACSTFVANNFDKIRNWIEDRMDPVDMCQLTNRCMQPKSKRVSRNDLTSDNACDLCSSTLNQWKDILVQNSTEQDFKELLLDLCNEVGFMVDQCRDMVDQYYVAVYDWLLHEFQPKTICQDIGMCPGKDLDSVNLWPVVPAGTDEMLKQRVAVPRINPQIIDKGGLIKDGPTEQDAAWFKSRSQVSPIMKTPGINIQPEIKPLNGYDVAPLPIERMTSVLDAAASESCAICQSVMHEIENVLMDGQTQDELKAIVENICDRMPKAIDTECKGFVERYGSLVIALLAQKFDPATVCPKMKLCPEGLEITIVSVAGAEYPKTITYDLADAKKTEPTKKRAAESVTCVICEYAVGMLQQVLNNNATMDEVREALDSLCDRLPDSVAGECELLVNAYSEELIDSFILDLTPEQTCRYLQLCKPPKVAIAPVLESTDMDKFLDFDVIPDDTDKKASDKKKVEASPGCILCEFVMKQMEDMLKDNKTDQNIEDNLKKVCKIMPKSVREDCTNFIDQYFNILLQTLEHVPPNEACTMLAFCSHRGTPKPVKVQKPKGQFKCAVCKDLMKLLKEVLMDERVDRKIAGDFEKICALLPKRVGKKYRSQCHDVMEHYGPYIISMLATLEKPEELCSYIDLCDPIPGLVKIDPNMENCSLGPKYFCSKKKRAQACGKVEFCRDEIWNKKKEGRKAKRATKDQK